MDKKDLHPYEDVHHHYLIRIEVGLILSLLFFIGVFEADIQPSGDKKEMVLETQEIVVMEEIVQTKQEERMPPPPRPVVPVAVPNDAVIADDILEFDSDLNFDQVLELPPPPPKASPEDEEEQIFAIVEQMPVLIGGLAAVQRNIVYPEMARLAGIEGRVIVQFVIDENGKVHDPVVVRGIGGGCDEEAVRAVKLATFRPGMQRGLPVKVRYNLPISFSLRSGD